MKLYSILNISESATDLEIHDAFIEVLRKSSQNDTYGSKYQSLRLAHNILIHPAYREIYHSFYNSDLKTQQGIVNQIVFTAVRFIAACETNQSIDYQTFCQVDYEQAIERIFDDAQKLLFIRNRIDFLFQVSESHEVSAIVHDILDTVSKEVNTKIEKYNRRYLYALVIRREALNLLDAHTHVIKTLINESIAYDIIDEAKRLQQIFKGDK